MDNRTITATFTVDEWNVISAGLGKLPLEAAIGVYQKILALANEQLTVAQAAATSDSPTRD